jgi:hypothetical protein
MIKRLLETDGILNGTGRVKGNGNNIKQILTNEKYIGDVLLQKTYTVDILEKKLFEQIA